jgi:hypothetical protein
MRAGLLADILLGENAELRDLINEFNFIILDPKGKITGFNHQMMRNSGKRENELMNQNFFVLFDPEDGNADMALRIKAALQGNPGPVAFSLPEQNLLFKGVVLPVYDNDSFPSYLIMLCKEEELVVKEADLLGNFWASATEFLSAAGISINQEEASPAMKKPRILLIEDQKGLVVKIFSKLLKSQSGNVLLAPGSEAGLAMAADFQPHAVISTYEPIGELNAAGIRTKMHELCKASTILVSSNGGEIRIEDGWLDIHVKNQAESVARIMDLINQIYLD